MSNATITAPEVDSWVTSLGHRAEPHRINVDVLMDDGQVGSFRGVRFQPLRIGQRVTVTADFEEAAE